MVPVCRLHDRHGIFLVYDEFHLTVANTCDMTGHSAGHDNKCLIHASKLTLIYDLLRR